MSLPSGYLQLEYIESTGDQWIETGIYGYANDVIEIKGNYTVLDQGHLFGCHNSGRYRRLRLLKYNDVSYYGGTAGVWNENTAMVGFGHAGTPLLTLGAADTNVHTFKFDHAHNSLTVDSNSAPFQNGYDAADREAPGVNVERHNTMTLFGYRHDSEFDVGARASFKLQSAKFTQNGVVTRNYVPALRLLDGKPGLYDLVSNTFSGNSMVTGSDFRYELPVYKTIVFDGTNEVNGYKTMIYDGVNEYSTYKTNVKIGE